MTVDEDTKQLPVPYPSLTLILCFGHNKLSSCSGAPIATLLQRFDAASQWHMVHPRLLRQS